jgi:Tol biopolymer transport system component
MLYGRRERGSGNPALRVLDLNSSQVSTIPGSQGLYAPRWSPDGQHLAALSSDAKRILLFDFKNQRWSDWTTGPGGRGYPAWSRDSKYLYFENLFTENPSYYRIRLGQTRPELLVDLKDLKMFKSSLGSWAGVTPDGSLLFVRDLSTDEIYALDLDLP